MLMSAALHHVLLYCPVVGQKSSRGLPGPAAEGTRVRTDQLRLSGPAGQMFTHIS